jgi:hypothetical protein
MRICLRTRFGRKPLTGCGNCGQPFSPARLDVAATAKLPGFAEHDIQILMAVGKLTPLGDPAPNAPKWFAAVEMIRLAADKDWLHKATKEISKYWRQKRERRMNLLSYASDVAR